MEGSRNRSAQVEAFLQKLRQGISSVFVYTITFMCLDENFTRTTVELPPASYDQIIDEETTRHLLEKKTLNWCRTTSRLVALKSNSRGRSSLLQAVSKAIWGLDDRDTETFLQQLMNMNLCSARESARFKERWENETRTSQSFCSHSNLKSSDQFLSWEEVCRAFQDSDGIWDGRTSDVDSIHIYTLSNLIKRPILVTEASEEDNSTSLGCSGLYLPNLLKVEDCIKSPVILAYRNQRFHPVVIQSESTESGHRIVPRIKAVPLVTCLFEQLPIRCLANEERQIQGFALIQSYLNIEEIPYTGPNALNHVLAARLSSNQPPLFNTSEYMESILETKSSSLGSRFSESTEYNKSYLQMKFEEETQTHKPKDAGNYTGVLARTFGLKCSDPSCNEPVDPDNYPKCKTHAKSHAKHPETVIKKNDGDAAGFLQTGQTHYDRNVSRKCIVLSCNKEGVQEYDGKCRMCYIQGNDGCNIATSANVETGELKSCEEPCVDREVSQTVRNNLGPVFSQITGREGMDETRYERQISDQPKCAVPICENPGLVTYNGVCIECFNAIWKSKNDKEVANSLRKEGRTNILEASGTIWRPGGIQTRIVTSKAKCLNEGCHSPVDDLDLGLCKKCFDKQRQALEVFERKKQERKGIVRQPSSPSSSPQRHLPQMSSGMHNPSDKELNRPWDHYPLPGQSRLSQEPSWKHRTQETRAKMCLSPHCDRFGDPGFLGYCSLCYARNN